jgi:hypothetical protein
VILCPDSGSYQRESKRITFNHRITSHRESLPEKLYQTGRYISIQLKHYLLLYFNLVAYNVVDQNGDLFCVLLLNCLQEMYNVPLITLVDSYFCLEMCMNLCYTYKWMIYE